MEETLQSSTTETTPQTPSTTPEANAQVYVPSSTEKKRAIMMYLLIGIIIVSFNNQTKSEFEQFHFKQALGWWAIFLLLVVVTSIFMLIPIIKYIPLLVVIIMVGLLGRFIKNARDGKYSIVKDSKLAVFVGLGEWILTLFEVNTTEKTDQKTPEIKN